MARAGEIEPSSTSWTQCRAGSRVTVDVYSANGHTWPRGDAQTPSAGLEIGRFFGGGPSLTRAT